MLVMFHMQYYLNDYDFLQDLNITENTLRKLS